jgi:hypothetical protein
MQLGFWPATVFFPVECWIKVFKPQNRLKYALRVLNVVCFLVTLATVIASIQLIVVQASTIQPFGQ